MATIVLRLVKGSALTNAEMDANFTNINNELALKLTASSYTAADVLSKLLTVDGSGSGLDADLLDGKNAVSTNTVSTIVARDSSGNFAAGTITANLTGNVTGNLTGNASTASDAALLDGLNTATTNTPSTVVVRDAGGNFAANIITATLNGNVTGNLTGNVTGNVTGNASTASDAALLDGKDTATTNTPNTVVTRDGSGNFAAGTITANLTGNVTGNVTGNLTGNVTGNASTASDAQASSVLDKSIAKAWVRFDGESAAAPIDSSFGVSDVTRTATGKYTITFSTAMSDANYCMVGSAGDESGGGWMISLNSNDGVPTTTDCRVEAWSDGSSRTSIRYISCAFFGL